MLNYIFSNIEKFIKEDEEYHLDCYFTITASVNFTSGDICYDTDSNSFTKSVVLFYIWYGIGGLTRDRDIFQKIKLKIKKEIEENPYNLIFNTKPLDIKVIHRNEWPYFLGRIMENGRMENSERLQRIASLERIRVGRREEESEEENEEEEEPIINTDKTFKSDECVICLTNPPNVLFCNCGHLCLCVECDEIKSLLVCPVCKTANYIKQTIEN